jgi:hypothetical protein
VPGCRLPLGIRRVERDEEGCGYLRQCLEISFPREITDFGELCLVKRSDPNSSLAFDCLARSTRFQSSHTRNPALEGMTSQNRLGPFYESTNEIQHGAMSVDESVSLFPHALVYGRRNWIALRAKV